MGTPLPTYTHLQEIADKAEHATGLRAEIIGGVIMISPTPRGKHFGAAALIRRQLDARVLGTYTVAEVSSVRALDDPDDYATPDLMVLPEEWELSDEWLADPDTVEVVSQSNHSKDTTQMPGWYAASRIPLFLLIDPRNGTWVLRSGPDGASYATEARGSFGDDVRLPPPFDMLLETESLPRYGPPK